jgi:hypothetical protein
MVHGAFVGVLAFPGPSSRRRSAKTAIPCCHESNPEAGQKLPGALITTKTVRSDRNEQWNFA